MSLKDLLKNKIKKYNLPDEPGIYKFLIKGKIAYIGRATSLKDRVKSYFSKDLINTRGKLILDMVEKTDDVKWQTTDSVLESVILEASLIKKYKPFYNTEGKDDRSFNYLVISKEDFPCIFIARQKDIDFSSIITNNYQLKTIFGPFPSKTILEEALKIIRKIFPYRDYKCHLNSGRPCFNYHLGLCPGACISKISKKDYAKIIRNITLIFDGKKNILLKKLKKEMSVLAKGGAFEKAGIVRDQIFALEHIKDVALIKNDFEAQIDSNLKRIESYDIAHLHGKEARGVMVVFENGLPNKKEYRIFTIKDAPLGDDIGALSEILERRKKHSEWASPDFVIIDGGQNQLNFAKKVLQGFVDGNKIVSVVKDEKHKPKDILGNNLLLEKNKDLIFKINEETHRFAISAHKKTRNREFRKSF